MSVTPVIFGCAGERLSRDEVNFFRDTCPMGLILFARNINNAQQVAELIDKFRDCTTADQCLVLTDQEGGRVQRFGPPIWRKAPAAATFAEIAKHNTDRASRAVRLNARLMAAELAHMGINVDCAPVLDLLQPGADEIISDRAFGADPQIVTLLGEAMMQGLLEGGCLPVIKHIPGHGRATADSHLELPVVESDLQTLDASDFAPFRALRHAPLAMTAHVVYSATDDRALSISPKAVRTLIRDRIGFKGVLISDDICMKALDGDYSARSRRVLEAGVDLVLHCSGEMTEMRAVAEGLHEAPAALASEIDKMLVELADARIEFDREACHLELQALLDGEAA